MTILRRVRWLPLTVRVPLLVVGLMLVLGAIASERVLSRLRVGDQRDREQADPRPKQRKARSDQRRCGCQRPDRVMPPARGHLDDARAGLRWPDQRPEGHGACQPHAACLQDGDPVH